MQQNSNISFAKMETFFSINIHPLCEISSFLRISGDRDVFFIGNVLGLGSNNQCGNSFY